jgi:hypothetical protein
MAFGGLAMFSIVLAASIMSQQPWSAARIAMDAAFMKPPYQAYLALKQVDCGATPPWVAMRMNSVVGLRQVRLKQKYGLTLSQFDQEALTQASFAKKQVLSMSCSFADASAAAIQSDALRYGGP